MTPFLAFSTDWCFAFMLKVLSEFNLNIKMKLKQLLSFVMLNFCRVPSAEKRSTVDGIAGRGVRLAPSPGIPTTEERRW